MATKYDKRLDRIVERGGGLEVVVAQMKTDDEHFEIWRLLQNKRGAVVIRKEDAAL